MKRARVLLVGLMLTSRLCVPTRGLNTVARRSSYRHEAKNSKFDAIVGSVNSQKEAMEFIKEVSNPKVNHNCWAFRLRNEDYCRFSDDGEPGGTAGRPILEALEREGVHNAICVVTRHYGGVKLGTGGLQRAYRAAAAGAVGAAGKSEIHMMHTIGLTVLPSQIGTFYNSLGAMDPALVDKLREDSTPEGALQIQLRLSADNLKILEREGVGLVWEVLEQE